MSIIFPMNGCESASQLKGYNRNLIERLQSKHFSITSTQNNVHMESNSQKIHWIRAPTVITGFQI